MQCNGTLPVTPAHDGTLRPARLLSVALLTLLICCWSSATGAYELPEGADGFRATRILYNHTWELLDKGEFQKLEALASELRTSKQRFSDNRWLLTAYYDTFAEIRLDDTGWQQLIATIERWRAAYPHSVTATTALGRAWYGYAWYARGHGYADTVSPENMKLYRERLETADSLVAPSPQQEDCPGRQLLWLTIAGLRGDEKTFSRAFKEAVAFAPDYFEIYQAAANHFLPRWTGVPGLWQDFATQSADQQPAPDGDILYLMIVDRIQRTGAISDLRTAGISWDRMLSGYRELARRAPYSTWNFNRQALFACLADDRKTLGKILRPSDFPYVPAAWIGVKVDDCLAKLELPPIAQRQEARQDAIIKNLNLQVFLDMLQLAHAGNREAMFAVSDMYLRGEGTSIDKLQAYVWLVQGGGSLTECHELYRQMSLEQQAKAPEELEKLKQSLAAKGN